MEKLKVGILGGTGMVGQRFVTLLDNHPWFEIVAIAASPRSAGKPYYETVANKWYGDKWEKFGGSIPNNVKNLIVSDVKEISKIKGSVDFVFSALDMPKEEIKAVEEAYAKNNIPVVSNNSAHRWTKDVPMIIPEINPHHLSLIETQKKNRGWAKGFIITKPNCSLQSYLLAVAPLLRFNPDKMIITTFQAISGAGKTFETFPEISDNVIPNISGEEEKSENEPLKILGEIQNGEIVNFNKIKISASCNRVATSDGHLATVSIRFEQKPSIEQILEIWNSYKPVPQQLKLPSAPDPVLIYSNDEFRPQTKLDRNAGKGMAISIGRLRPCPVLDYRFVALSHNTIRGAAGGAILSAELLIAKGYIKN